MIPHIADTRAITLQDIDTMRTAVKMAVERSEISDVVVAPIVYRLYDRGLKDPVRLAKAAGMLASSKTFS